MPRKISKKKSRKLDKKAAKKRRVKETVSKKPSKKKKVVASKKKNAPKNKAVNKKKIGNKTRTKHPARSRVSADNKNLDLDEFNLQVPRPRVERQSGDLQGLSTVEGADSESVGELIEEGNAFEADVVAGVERAGRNEGKEVHTHEVPEDDVPEEYLDED